MLNEQEKLSFKSSGSTLQQKTSEPAVFKWLDFFLGLLISAPILLLNFIINFSGDTYYLPAEIRIRNIIIVTGGAFVTLGLLYASLYFEKKRPGISYGITVIIVLLAWLLW